MAKRYKPPVNYRATPVSVSNEPIEVETTPDGTYGVIAETPHYDLLTYPMTVTVGGVSRARVAGSPAAGQYRILSTTVYGSDGQPHTEYLPVLEFHSSDNGLAGAVSYYRTGTVLTAQYLRMLRAFVQPICGYASFGALGAAYPAQSDPDIRGHDGDWALLTDGTMAAVINGSWAIMVGGGAGGSSPIVPVAAWMLMSSVPPTVVVAGAVSVSPSAAYMMFYSADPSVDIASGSSVSPAARFAIFAGVAPTVVISLIAPTGHSVAPGNTLNTLHPGTCSGATSYNAYWTSDGSTPSKTNGTKITGVADGQQHTGLNNGTAYKYVFTSQSSWGESAESGVDTATPEVPANGGVAFTDTFTGSNGAAPNTNYWNSPSISGADGASTCNIQSNKLQMYLKSSSGASGIYLTAKETSGFPLWAANKSIEAKISFDLPETGAVDWTKRVGFKTHGKVLTTSSVECSVYRGGTNVIMLLVQWSFQIEDPEFGVYQGSAYSNILIPANPNGEHTITLQFVDATHITVLLDGNATSVTNMLLTIDGYTLNWGTTGVEILAFMGSDDTADFRTATIDDFQVVT